jgi:ATP-dependent HslUV protease subunit HslV
MPAEKSTANKIRALANNSIIAGFAGATADAFTLFSRLEEKLDKHSHNLMRASVELAKDWRLDKYLRRLEAMIIVADKESTLILSGNGDVLEPEDGIAAIGSGGNYALAAAKALSDVKNIKLEDKAKKVILLKVVGGKHDYPNDIDVHVYAWEFFKSTIK